MSIDKIDGSNRMSGIDPDRNRRRVRNSAKKPVNNKPGFNVQINKLRQDSSVELEKTKDYYTKASQNVYHGTMLINALNIHKTTVQSIKQLSAQQNDLLKTKNYGELFNSRYEKEDLIQKLKKWSNEIRFYYENWNDWEGKLTDGERNSLMKITEGISSTIEDVLDLEAENRVLLEKRKNELTDELGTINFYQESLFSVFENKN